MRVFMLGWEFPPYISGGLGTACYGLTRGLDELGAEVVFVLPRPVVHQANAHVQLRTPDAATAAGFDATDPTAAAAALGSFRLESLPHIEFRTIDAPLTPYDSPGAPAPIVAPSPQATQTGDLVASVPPGVVAHTVGAPPRPAPAGSALPPIPEAAGSPTAGGAGADYSGDLYHQVERYAGLARAIARTEQFDLIHAHDWMTFPAGVAVQKLTGKPLIVQVHSTEFDRSGLHVNQRVYDIERQGMHHAARVIAVSHLTRNIIAGRYGVSPRKIRVVYNAIDDNGPSESIPLQPIQKDEKIVLFLGRITMQKGPEYFLAAAKRVLEVESNVRFVVAGSGDMARRMIEMAAELGIGHKVLFTGFLRGDDVRRVFSMADLYVMPSVSEPFGIAPLEALVNDVPVLISKQSGVAEVLTHALKVDFWDVDEMANKIVAVLRHPPLQTTLRDHGRMEVRRMSWTDSARDCVGVYNELVAPGRRLNV
jgi:glycosyltransferase involved in cell wall biosynthesis